MGAIAAVEAEATRNGHTLLLVDTHDEPEKELAMVQELVRRRVDGLLLAPSPGADGRTLQFLASKSVPVVLLDRFLPVDVDQVGVTNEEPSAQLVEHLLDLGNRRIGFVAGLEGLSTTSERLAGYRLALQRRGVELDDNLVAYGGSQREPARNATHRLLDVTDPPTALVSANNAMTIGVLHALQERGLNVPRNIALVAFDDFEWSDLFEPRLTVVAQPIDAVGKQAVQLLLARLDNPDRQRQTLRIQSTFVHRESCGCNVNTNK